MVDRRGRPHGRRQLRTRHRRERVLAAMRSVPRHRFVPETSRRAAYDDRPLPIGFGQTISQPYIVAFMTEALALSPADVGPGDRHRIRLSGRRPRRAAPARSTPSRSCPSWPSGRALRSMGCGYRHVHVRHGDGYGGWPEHAPFPKVIVTAAPDAVPRVARRPAGHRRHDGACRLDRTPANRSCGSCGRPQHGVVSERSLPVRFVPMVRP